MTQGGRGENGLCGSWVIVTFCDRGNAKVIRRHNVEYRGAERDEKFQPDPNHEKIYIKLYSTRTPLCPGLMQILSWHPCCRFDSRDAPPSNALSKPKIVV